MAKKKVRQPKGVIDHLEKGIRRYTKKIRASYRKPKVRGIRDVLDQGRKRAGCKYALVWWLKGKPALYSCHKTLGAARKQWAIEVEGSARVRRKQPGFRQAIGLDPKPTRWAIYDLRTGKKVPKKKKRG